MQANFSAVPVSRVRYFSSSVRDSRRSRENYFGLLREGDNALCIKLVTPSFR